MRNLTVEQQYSPSLGLKRVIPGFTTDINAPYTFSSSLPTQVFKVYAKNNATTNYSRIIGEKSYELNDHLGNFNDTWVLSSKTLSGINPVRNLSEATGIRVVISDRKYLADRDDSNTITTGDNFVPEVLSANEYGAFGNLLNGRGFSKRAYSRGFNGMLKDDDVKGNGNSYTTEFRQYDPRIGRWLSLDPVNELMVQISPYCGLDNNPIWLSDPKGDSPPWLLRLLMQASRLLGSGGGSSVRGDLTRVILEIGAHIYEYNSNPKPIVEEVTKQKWRENYNKDIKPQLKVESYTEPRNEIEKSTFAKVKSGLIEGVEIGQPYNRDGVTIKNITFLV
jgi:RHS repeat-associated protein